MWEQYVGEMDADELADTLLKQDNRVAKQIQVQDIGVANQLFEDLMGKSSDPRKKFIELHAHEANLDI